MSHPSSQGAHLAPPSPDPASQANLSAAMDALRQSLQDASMALASCYGHMPGAATAEQSPVPEQNGTQDHERSTPPQDGETRSYYFSPQTLRRERALLSENRVADWPELLRQAHYRLMGLSRLMKSVDHDARIKGQAISSLGCLLEQATAPVQRMISIYGTMERVKTSVE